MFVVNILHNFQIAFEFYHYNHDDRVSSVLIKFRNVLHNTHNIRTIAFHGKY